MTQTTAYLLKLMASKWTVPILEVLQEDTLRFSEIQKHIPDISQKALTASLRKLEHCNMLSRKVYPSIPPQVEYKLTALGIELLKISGEVAMWGVKYIDDVK
ncbi:MAG TPA: helix-turn-helix domain-containing protein [Lactobacillaceae bacterium]|jgi:DNA-binding HxlR family transcriptional regulator